MAAKLQFLVAAILVLAAPAVTLNDSKKKITLDPLTAKDVAAAFQGALKEEEPLLMDEDKIAGGLRKKSLVNTKISVTKPNEETPLNDGWQSDFERDVSSLIIGLSEGGLGATPFGESVKKIADLIEKDMKPKVLWAHGNDTAQLTKLHGALDKCKTDYDTAKSTALATKQSYEGNSTLHKACRKVEEGLFDDSQKCHSEWIAAKETKKLKCDAYLAKQNKYSETNTNKQVVEKAASEGVETYLTRIHTTICGEKVDCCADGACAGEFKTTCSGVQPGGDCPERTEGSNLHIGFLQDTLCHKKSCEDATKAFNDKTAECKEADRLWNEKRMACNQIQKQMDDDACKYAVDLKDACEVYEGCGGSSGTDRQAFEDFEAETKKDEADRKAEWRGLQRMKCIIDAFVDGNVTHAEIDACKNKNWANGCAECADEKLTITYPVPHPVPVPECLTTDMYPNTDQYKAAEFTPLPARAKSNPEANPCTGLIEVSITPKTHEGVVTPSECKCEKVILNGPYTPGAIVRCEDCIDVFKSLDPNSCPEGTKLFAPKTRADWETFLKSANYGLVKAPNFIVDVTCPHDNCPFTSPMSYEAQENAPFHHRWHTSNVESWWLTGAHTHPAGAYLANCYMNLGMNASDEPAPTADTVTFSQDACNYHSKSYYCQQKPFGVKPAAGSPAGCVCHKVSLVGNYAAGSLIKCEKCKDVYKSLDPNSCPEGTKIFSPSSREDWKTFLASAVALRSPHWIIDVTRPADGCGGCQDAAMNSNVPAQKTWTTSDNSPWWLRDTKAAQPDGDYKANCYMDLYKDPGNADAVTFSDNDCHVHSRSYYCQPRIPTCSDHTCSAGMAKKVGVDTTPGATDQICCTDTCAMYDCKTAGWIKQDNVDTLADPDDTKCCQQSCAAYNCTTEGFAKKNGVDGVAPASEAGCCEQITCKDYVCTTPQWTHQAGYATKAVAARSDANCCEAPPAPPTPSFNESVGFCAEDGFTATEQFSGGSCWCANQTGVSDTIDNCWNVFKTWSKVQCVSQSSNECHAFQSEIAKPTDCPTECSSGKAGSSKGGTGNAINKYVANGDAGATSRVVT